MRRAYANRLLFVALAIGLIPLVVFFVERATLAVVFALPGAVVRPDASILVLLVLVAVAAISIPSEHELRRAGGPALVLLLTGAAVMALLADVGASADGWSYYNSKLLWLVGAGLLWLLLLPAVHVVRAAPSGPPRMPYVLGVLAVAILAPTVADVSTPLPSPLKQAAEGWSQPAAVNVTALQRFGDRPEPFIFWHWSDGTTYTGEDRIANFWVAGIWGTTAAGAPIDVGTLSGGPRSWAYSSSGDIEQLCDIMRRVPGLRVVTRNPALEGDLTTACPDASSDVFLDA